MVNRLEANIKRPLLRPVLTSLLFISLIIPTLASSYLDQVYFIQFTDKSIDYSVIPVSDLAMERRMKYGIELNDEDYPVNPRYVSDVLNIDSVIFRYSLKWLNGIVVHTTRGQLDSIKALPFVRNVQFVGLHSYNGYESFHPSTLHSYVKNTEIQTSRLTKEGYGQSYAQIEQLNIHKMHLQGYDGSNVKVAVFDAGFSKLDQIAAFSRAIGNDHITLGYDLVDLDNDPLGRDNHGTSVSSCMIAYQPNQYVGSAPNAQYFLFRTENGATEFPLEELNWCKAAEIADSIGVDIVTSSLGYTQFQIDSLSYDHTDLDGRTSYISSAARNLVNRGIVVVNSAGNERDNEWVKIGTPADVPEVITVGAVDITGFISNFSSSGPNSKGVVKPDVCAMGSKIIVVSTSGSYYPGFGTSYSTPLLSGGVSCLMQAHPNRSPQEIAEALRVTANQCDHPDSLYGYGIANIYAAHLLLSTDNSSQPFMLDSAELLVYTSSYTDLRYVIYEKKRFLYIFRRLKPVSPPSEMSVNKVAKLQFNITGQENCTKKYTIKVELSNSVDKRKLIINDLSPCDT